MESYIESIRSDELLARYIFHNRYFREDNTIRPDAFIPFPYPDLSVTRHLALSGEQLQSIGLLIAAQQNKNLYGRADVMTSVVTGLSLSVQSAPTQDNPNHANIIGWSLEKSEQKIIAQQIAASIHSTVRY